MGFAVFVSIGTLLFFVCEGGGILRHLEETEDEDSDSKPLRKFVAQVCDDLTQGHLSQLLLLGLRQIHIVGFARIHEVCATTELANKLFHSLLHLAIPVNLF